MSSQEYFEMYLLILKSSVEVYVHGTLESSNNEVRNILKRGLDETMDHQALTYDYMKELGWYCISNVEPKKVKQVYESLQNNS